MIEDVERQLEADRDAAVASAMPDPESDKAHQDVYCDDDLSRDQAALWHRQSGFKTQRCLGLAQASQPFT